MHQGPLFVCGRETDATRRMARSLGADEVFIGWELAVRSPRVQAVVLALPNDLHEPVSIAALRAGKHVYVEKPIANTLASADHMISTADALGLVLSVGENVQCRGDLRIAKSMLADLGQLQAIHTTFHHRNGPSGWRCERRRMGGGILIDFGVHHVRAIRQLL